MLPPVPPPVRSTAPSIWFIDLCSPPSRFAPRRTTFAWIVSEEQLMAPAWSRDGEWGYFSWIRQGDQDIWRTRVRTGSKERVTHDGGFIPYESVDRKTLLHLPKPFNSPLMAQPLDGGTPRQVIRCVAGTAFSVSRTGIYYVPCSDPSPDPDPSVHVIDPGTGTDRELGRLEKFQYSSLPSGFDVSGRTILYGRLVRSEADLMMIENFK
jgi:hypothetical protein